MVMTITEANVSECVWYARLCLKGFVCISRLSLLPTWARHMLLCYRHTTSQSGGCTSDSRLLRALHVHSLCYGTRSKLCLPQASRLVEEKELLSTELSEARQTVWMPDPCEGCVTEAL